ncbi:MAG: SoxR reducing system RseC family protein [Thalassolituus sp.]
MNQEIVEVVEIGDGGIWVEGVQRSACGSCSARAGCGQHSLSKLGRPVRLWVKSSQAFQVGQQVVLALPQGSLALSALNMYGLPLIGLIAGAMAGYSTGSEPASVVTGLLGLGAGLLLARWIARRREQDWQPQILNQCNGFSGSSD